MYSVYTLDGAFVYMNRMLRFYSQHTKGQCNAHRHFILHINTSTSKTKQKQKQFNKKFNFNTWSERSGLYTQMKADKLKFLKHKNTLKYISTLMVFSSSHPTNDKTAT